MGEEREESREDKRGQESASYAMWISCLHLTIVLTPFDHFNSLSHDMG